MDKYGAIITVVIIMMGLISCRQPDDTLYRLDQESMHYLHLFFDQEKDWSEALKNQDIDNALAQLDTMQLIVLLFWETANFEHRSIPLEDSAFFAAKKNLWQWMAVLTDSIYPLIAGKALLPRVNYTHAVEGELMELIARNDSILTAKLDTLRALRMEFSGLRYHLQGFQ